MKTSIASAVIFDFDGVIVDTEPLHFRAFQEVLEPEKLAFPWRDYVSTYIGFDDRDAFRTRYKNAGKKLDENRLPDLVERKAKAFHSLVTMAGAKPYPGVLELIASIAGRLPLALCSGALRSDIAPVFRTLGLETAFDVMVTADDVHASKPDPASYKLAVERLKTRFPDRKIEAKTCVAIEDTPAGIKAAKGAGLKVIAVTNSHGRDKLFDADRIVTSVAGLKF